MKDVSLTQLNRRIGPKITGKVNTVFSSDLGKVYPSDKLSSRAIQLSFTNRRLAHILGTEITVRQTSTQSLTEEELNDVVMIPKNAILAVQTILIRTSPEYRIWMIYNSNSMLYNFIRMAKKPRDFFGPRLPENWDKESEFLMEGQYDIWSSAFYTKLLEWCKQTKNEPPNLRYVFSDDESLEARENSKYLALLQKQLGLLPSDDNDTDTDDDTDTIMEEVEEYDVEEDLDKLNLDIVNGKDKELNKNFLLRHTSLTITTQKIITFIQDECYNNCSLYMLTCRIEYPISYEGYYKGVYKTRNAISYSI